MGGDWLPIWVDGGEPTRLDGPPPWEGVALVPLSLEGGLTSSGLLPR